MQDERFQACQSDVKPLSLESAIIDVAPRVCGCPPKPSAAQQPTTKRSQIGERIKLSSTGHAS
ncbi:MAG: hypothetical protein AAGJ54_02070 [Planctomycetota bacterium]